MNILSPTLSQFYEMCIIREDFLKKSQTLVIGRVLSAPLKQELWDLQCPFL